MAFQIFNDGAVIRIENGTKTLLVTKEQVKTIDTIQNNIVRIDIGEGPLKNIFINYQDVSAPVVASGNELREVIKGMLLSDNYDGGDATAQNQVSIINQLATLTNVLQAIKAKEDDYSKNDPTLIDESNPYMIYHGWHRSKGFPENNEWGIMRIRRDGDTIIREWVNGTKAQVFKWDLRGELGYIPFDYVGPE